MTQELSDPRIDRLSLSASFKIRSYLFSETGVGTKDPSQTPQLLGLGGSSVVYKVFQELDVKRNITVPRALKLFVMREDLVSRDADTTFLPAQANFLEEIRNVAQLAHENLVQVVDAGEETIHLVDGTSKAVPYLVTHLVTGCTLRDIIEQKDAGDFARQRIIERPQTAVELISQIGRALSYLHSKKFLHCDIAPKNVFVEDVVAQSSLRSVVGDVGMSRCLFGDQKERLFIAGTPSFSPDEVSAHFGKQVLREELEAWFPYWDLFGFAKTARDLLKYAKTLSNHAWIDAASNKAEMILSQIKNFKSAEEIATEIEYCLPIHRERGGVPELEPSAVGTRKRMMPLEALSLTKRIDSLVRHPALVRLLAVPQLTIVRSASPGGNHSRYEHSLGVMENVRQMLSTLLDEPKFLGALGRDSIETGLLAAVLYNSSRFPFSNIIHELNKRLPPGEKKIFESFNRASLLEEIFSDKFRSHAGKTLQEKINEDFPAVDITKLLRILGSGPSSGFQYQDEAILHALLNSSLDARVIDFVRRDSLHLGLSSGDFFALDDLLPHLTILPLSASNPAPKVCLRTSGVSVAEQIILMRYWLYQRVYWNQPNRAYNAAIRRALLDLQQVLTFEKEMRQIALYFDEREMLFFLHERAVNYNLSETIELLDLVKGSEKILYREVFDRNLRQCEADPGTMDRTEIEMLISSTMSYKTMRKFEIELQQWLFDSLPHQPAKGAPLVLLDVPFEPGNIKLGTDIFVQLPPTSKFENSPQSLTTLEKVSPVIEGVNSNFSSDLQRLRIFVRPDLKFDLDIGQRIYHKLRTLLNS